MPFIDHGPTPVLESISAFETRETTRLVAVAIMAGVDKNGRTLAVVIRNYAYKTSVKRGRKTLEELEVQVPEGFVTDFASVPSAFHFAVQPFGRHAPAAVVHDYLYAIGQPGKRALADRIFLHAMRESGVPPIRRTLMYWAVRLGGGGGYGLTHDWKFADPGTGEWLAVAPERPLSWIRAG
jgi:hypothetical protein